MPSSSESDNTATRPEWVDEAGRRRFLSALPRRPGVYRMIDDRGRVVYVGKAADLRKRVASYLRRTGLAPKTRALMNHVRDIEVTVTRTESEALILENNLIKSLKPRYNILLRDDKTYPSIRLTASHAFPRLSVYRGRRREGDRYFGPYPSASVVRETVDLVQKLFRLRTCEDGFFRNRSRPCLQFQIGRCSAPCVGRISQAEYARDVENAVLFIEGRDDVVTEFLARRMDEAAERLEFERAAVYRDRIACLRRFQEKQFVSNAGSRADVDVVACAAHGRQACIEVFHIRAGRNLGSRTLYPRLPAETDTAEIVSAFLPRFYIGRELPSEIIVEAPADEAALLESTLSDLSGRRVLVVTRPKGERAEWLRLAELNARQNLSRREGRQDRIAERFSELRSVLGLEALTRIECFDISHTSGEATIASCVVFDVDGPVRSDYRRFNISGIRAGDDYAAMHQALLRRLRGGPGEGGKWPDLLLIDGGKGQVRQALDVYAALGLEVGRTGPEIVGVAKGPERIAGQEWLYRASRDEILRLPEDSPALHLIQAVRDEAHRFAIGGHRRRRAKTRTTSVLEQIPGVGPARRRRLLRHFGGLQGIRRATPADLRAIEGIDRALADRIYSAFHADDA